MSKKFGKIMKVVTVFAGIAAVGTACYLYKDKIKEFFEKIELKDKLDSAKSFVTDKILGSKEDDFFDDAEFFDSEAEEEEDTSNRGYTSININTEEPAAPVTAVAEEPKHFEFVSREDSSEEETVTSDDEEVTFEYEGLSDVSEDDDVLAEESALDGTMEF